MYIYYTLSNEYSIVANCCTWIYIYSTLYIKQSCKQMKAIEINRNPKYLIGFLLMKLIGFP